MTSIVIAAHNEAAVLGRILDAVVGAAVDGEFDIVVAANGCTDDTAAVAAARPGVRVVELGVASKSAALNAGDAAALRFPRIYLDADIVFPAESVRRLAAAVSGPGAPLAAVPRRQLDVAGRPLAVRGFYAVNARLPAYRHALYGRGVIALSEAGRGRFERFPDLFADDLFLDSLFADEEKLELGAVASRIVTPRRTRDLVRRLARVRAGNAAMRAAGHASALNAGDDASGVAGAGGSVPVAVRPASRSSWLRDVVLPRPWLLPAGACYAGLVAVAELTARRNARHGTTWGRDESSREVAGE